MLIHGGSASSRLLYDPHSIIFTLLINIFYELVYGVFSMKKLCKEIDVELEQHYQELVDPEL